MGDLKFHLRDGTSDCIIICLVHLFHNIKLIFIFNSMIILVMFYINYIFFSILYLILTALIFVYFHNFV